MCIATQYFDSIWAFPAQFSSIYGPFSFPIAIISILPVLFCETFISWGHQIRCQLWERFTSLALEGTGSYCWWPSIHPYIYTTSFFHFLGDFTKNKFVYNVILIIIHSSSCLCIIDFRLVKKNKLRGSCKLITIKWFFSKLRNILQMLDTLLWRYMPTFSKKML